MTEIRLSLEHSDADLEHAAAAKLGIDQRDLESVRIHRKSLDARKRRSPVFIYSLDIEIKSGLGEGRSEETLLQKFEADPHVSLAKEPTYSPIQAPSDAGADDSRPIVVGSGPCGLFAGLILAQMGLRPLVLERGKPASERLLDVGRFWKTGDLDPESNVQFGEGGAGTFSDGKLTTQIKDRQGRCEKVLRELVAAGAPEEILYVHKPHIGTDNLIKVVAQIRATIESLGGELRFGSHVTDLKIENGAVRGVSLASGEEIAASSVTLAIGHSARDTFELLVARGVPLEAKAFSIGVRIEHPQAMIDRAQYGDLACHPRIGRADYKLVHHSSNGRSVYSFCVCPGGRVVAAASEPGGVTTNGMSAFARDLKNANGALLVGVKPADFEDFPYERMGREGDTADWGVLAGVAFQRHWERKAFELGGGDYSAPAQLVEDFLAGRRSEKLGSVKPTYRPGVVLTDLSQCLPVYGVEALREAFGAFARKIKTFAQKDAVLTGVETRSSSPVRILRGSSFESLGIKGLFPAGEGAGYAGGIVSSAVDGIRVAEAVVASQNSKSP